jgi:broad specificity phosphatase PhoE
VGVLYLLRHGQASFGTDDYDQLSDLGRKQAELLGRELRTRGVTINVAVCGTMRRQRDTAALALASAGVDVGVDVEIDVDGRWNEYDYTDIIARYADGTELLATPSVRAGATMTEVASPRVFQALLDVGLAGWISAREHGGPGSWPAFAGAIGDALDGLVRGLTSGSTAVVFTSAGPITAVCAQLMGLSPDGCVALNRVMVNASITKVVSGRSGVSLVSINEHGHLEAAGRACVTYR